MRRIVVVVLLILFILNSKVKSDSNIIGNNVIEYNMRGIPLLDGRRVEKLVLTNDALYLIIGKVEGISNIFSSSINFTVLEKGETSGSVLCSIEDTSCAKLFMMNSDVYKLGSNSVERISFNTNLICRIISFKHMWGVDIKTGCYWILYGKLSLIHGENTQNEFDVITVPISYIGIGQQRVFYEELKRWGIDTNEYNVPEEKLPPEWKPKPKI